MTISYSTTTPNPPNDPADDVAIMQSNAAAISQALAIDHVGFNVSGSGQHNRVTFNANNVPVPPTSPPILFTNTVAGLPQLFFYSGNAAHSSNQYVSSASGSSLLMGGMIIKWGSATSNGGPNAVTFASAFPNNCFSVIAQPINAGAATIANDYVYVSGQSTAGFNATGSRRTTLTAASVNFFYIAIGN